MKYKQIVENWTTPVGTTAPIHQGCVIQIPLRPRSFWSGLLGTDPRGTLVYGGGMGRRTTHFIDLLFFEPTDRLAGWGYCPRRQTASENWERKVNAREKALRPYREAALKALDPLPVALERYARDNSHYPSHLSDLTPRYVSSLPKLPPTFGPTHYEKIGHFHFLWVRLNQEVTDASGKPLDISGTFGYGPEGSGPEMLFDRSDRNSRPLYRHPGVGRWALYD